MSDSYVEPPEFTDEELLAALKRVGQAARDAAFAAGRPVVVLRDSMLVAIYSDGKEVIIGPPSPANGSVASQ